MTTAWTEAEKAAFYQRMVEIDREVAAADLTELHRMALRALSYGAAPLQITQGYRAVTELVRRAGGAE